jgi:hypothetical protein
MEVAMVAPARAFPLSVSELAPPLAVVDLFCDLPSWQQARQRGVDTERLRLDYDRLLLSAARDPQLGPFWQRWSVAHHVVFQPREAGAPSAPDDPVAWVARFLHEEFVRFCQARDTPSAVRNRLLAHLMDAQTHERASRAVQTRLLELTFLPRVVFPWVTIIDTFAQQLRTYNRRLQRQLQALDHHFAQTAPYFQTHPAHAQHTDLRAALRRVLHDAEATVRDVERWKKTLGITNRPSIAPQKQGIWTPVFVAMLPLLRPFCSGPKSRYLAESGAMPEEAYALASTLTNLSCPALWPDVPQRAKARWDAYHRVSKRLLKTPSL